jgi:hypothetical protein
LALLIRAPAIAAAWPEPIEHAVGALLAQQPKAKGAAQPGVGRRGKRGRTVIPALVPHISLA